MMCVFLLNVSCVTFIFNSSPVSDFREESIALAILRLVELEKAVVEGAGSVGLAALIENSLPELKGKKYED